MAECKQRTVVTDGSGNLWDLGNPNIIAVKSASAGASSILENFTGSEIPITVDFATASAAFNAS